MFPTLISIFSHVDKFDNNFIISLQSLNKGFIGDIFNTIGYTQAWIPLYLLILYLVFKYEKRNALQICLFVVLIIFCSDQITSGAIEPLLKRFRCHEPQELKAIMHNVGNYVGNLGVVSSYTANSFSVATFLNLVMHRRCHKIPLLFLWPISVSFSKCIVGAHYISDVYSGATIGIIMGIIFFYIYKRRRTIFRKILRYFTSVNMLR